VLVCIVTLGRKLYIKLKNGTGLKFQIIWHKITDKTEVIVKIGPK
jgi:hypothetical protein